jgi:hypothetical protein
MGNSAFEVALDWILPSMKASRKSPARSVCVAYFEEEVWSGQRDSPNPIVSRCQSGSR